MKTISKLDDLINTIIEVSYFVGEDENGEEIDVPIKVKVCDAYIEDWYFYNKWNEPLNVVIKICPIDDEDYYTDFDNKYELEYEFFNDDFNLYDIKKIY
jgi:hypothetical protein